MAIRPFLDISTAHLSAAARAWLSEGATLNHAVNFHGTGSGAAIGTLGATHYGWFMHAPEPPPEGIDHGMPNELQAICEYARSKDCHYILFDAEAEIDPALPVLDEDIAGEF